MTTAPTKSAKNNAAPAPKGDKKTSARATALNANAALADRMHQAAAHMNVGDHGSALRLYREALELVPDSAGGAFGLAVLLNRMGQYGEAMEWLQRLQNSVGKLRTKDSATLRSGIWAQVGIAQQGLGQLIRAVDAFTTAHKLTPTKALRELIEELRPLAAAPLAVQQLIIQGRQYAALRQMDQSMQAYSAALQLQADNALALHGLAMVQRSRGQLAQALPLLQKAIVLMPERADFFNDLGIIFQDRGEFSQAVSFHKRALKIKPDFTLALLNLGAAQKRLGASDDALTTYTAVLNIDPDLPEAHNNIGNLYRTLGRFDEARQHLRTALELRPNYSDAIANLESLSSDIAAASQALASKTKTPKTTKANSTTTRAGAARTEPATRSSNANPLAHRTRKG